MTDENTTNVPPGWEPLPPEPLPRPNFFPAGVAMGTHSFFGVDHFMGNPCRGIGLFAASLAGWIYEILRERSHR